MPLTASENKLQEEIFVLEGLKCPVCASKIVKEIDKMPGIEKVDYNTVSGKLKIKSIYAVNNIVDKVQKIVSRVESGIIVKRINGKENQYIHKQNFKQRGHTHSSTNYWRLGIGSIIFITALVLYFLPVLADKFSEWQKQLLFILSYVLIGGPVIISSLRNIFKGQLFDEKFLMTAATIGAFAIGEFPEGAAVMLFYMIGEMFQDKAVTRSRRSIKELMDIQAEYANVKANTKIKKVPAEKVDIGTIIIVKPGEKVPIDGEVIAGKTMIDSSALTGESVPQKIEPGDTVLSGMINKNGLIRVKTEKLYEESTAARILDLVENAASKKSKTEEFITKFARYYTPVVVFTAIAVAFIPPLILPGAIFTDWLYRALIFLVISCPCALVISIPLSFFAGIGKASRQGILIKGGNYLEALRRVEKIVFDKTGTLTRGIFEVSKVKAENNFNEDDVLSLAAIAEYHSNHPIALSIMKAAGSCIKNNKIKSYEEISGYGVKVRTVSKEIIAGSRKLLINEGIHCKAAADQGTIVYVAVDKELAGYIVITDKIKENAFSVLNSLKNNGIKEVIMLTGDRDKVAGRVAKKLNIDKYYAELMPDDKVNKLEDMISATSGKGKVVFVGDGINDAPVLARSDIGIAMGGLGSDAAIEAADVVLMTDELSRLPVAIQTAERTGKIIWQNIVMILAIKIVVLGMGIYGTATMWEAVFADVGVALLAVLNSIRILRNRS